ncbi:GNAT family N-acetyltransferase [Saccharothrix hoggarensis]|uniref:GNAT family N-acetyltransferase n=1 Tax=Saccharothrix hoggarensis TaxID=913853 RepID=A0ABW3R2L2_9PSEU
MGAEPFDVAGAAEEDLRAVHRVMLAAQAVDRPDEAPLTFEALVGALRTPPAGFGPRRCWVLRRGGGIVAIAFANFPEAENGHLSLVTITVHPEQRRQGVGTAFLRDLLPELEGRTVVEGWEITRGGAGEHWATAVGFRVVNTMVLQLLSVAEVDRATWDVPAPAGYRVEDWAGATPDALLGSLAWARNALRDAPFGDIDFQAPLWTPERVREAEADLRARGVDQRMVVAVHEESGDVVGVTEVEVRPHRPRWASQRETSVLRAHRGHGLGRCIKAHMAWRLLADRPDIERFYTTTSADNTHMIRVNEAIGYRTVRTLVSVKQDVAVLASHPGVRG